METLSFSPFSLPLLDPFDRQMGTVRLRRSKDQVLFELKTQILIARRFAVVLHPGIVTRNDTKLLGPYPIDAIARLGEFQANLQRKTETSFGYSGDLERLVDCTLVVYDLDAPTGTPMDRVRNAYGVPILDATLTAAHFNRRQPVLTVQA